MERTKLILKLAKDQNQRTEEQHSKSVEVWKISTDHNNANSFANTIAPRQTDIDVNVLPDIAHLLTDITNIPSNSVNMDLVNEDAIEKEFLYENSTHKTIRLPSTSYDNSNDNQVATSSKVLFDKLSNENAGTSSSNSDSGESCNEPFGSGGSDADPDFVAEILPSSSSDSSDHNEIQNEAEQKRRSVKYPSQVEKASKKRKCNRDEWQKLKAKRLRNRGLAYESIRVTKTNDGSMERIKVMRDAKKMLPPCDNKCRLTCSTKFTEDQRQKIFEEYWELGELQRQRDFLSSCMSSIKPKYRYEKAETCRRLNNAFYLESNEQRVRVCKHFFMATLGINSRSIRTVIAKQETMTKGILKPEMRGKHANHTTVAEGIKEGVRNHINSIPKIPSHYCRSQSKKEYIDGGKSVADLHRDYKKSCQEKNVPYANYLMYYGIFHQEFNIGFFSPKKDQCELCLAFIGANPEEKNQIQAKYDTHLREKELSRIEKESDKASNSMVIVYDLQAVLPCPIGDASSYYYVSKLNVFNLTMFELQTNKAFCYVWHEAEARRGVNEIGSCVWNYLVTLQENIAASTDNSKPLDVIFYTDNCAGQNKNKFIVALYMYAVLKLESLQSITHKFLITGHTQNEGDHVHSIIEKAIKRNKKSGPIYVPDQYVAIIRQAKKTGNPFSVHEMCHQDFLDLKDLPTQFGMKNIYKNSEGETIKMTDIKIFMLTKEQPGTMFYKTSYDQKQFLTINICNPRRQGADIPSFKLRNAYKQKPGITEAKKKGLLSLFSEKPEKRVVPLYYYDFYNRL